MHAGHRYHCQNHCQNVVGKQRLPNDEMGFVFAIIIIIIIKRIFIEDEHSNSSCFKTASKNCFNAFNAAIEAVQKNDATGAAIILRSVRKDGELLQTEARKLHEQLRRVEQNKVTRVENLTRDINELHKEEQQVKQEKINLKTKLSSLNADREHHQQSRNEAQRRYGDAIDKQRSAERRLEEFESNWWVPIYGQVLLVRELIEDNQQQANNAERDKNRHERDVENADREIRSINDNINQVRQIKRLN